MQFRYMHATELGFLEVHFYNLAGLRSCANLTFCLFLALQQGSLSSEGELSQYFSVHDVPSQSSLSETMAMGSSDDDMLHSSRSCNTSIEEAAAPQPHGSLITFLHLYSMCIFIQFPIFYNHKCSYMSFYDHSLSRCFL